MRIQDEFVRSGLGAFSQHSYGGRLPPPAHPTINQSNNSKNALGKVPRANRSILRAW